MWVQREIWFCPVMFGMNTRLAFLFLKQASKLLSLDLTGKKHRTAKNAVSIVTWNRLWCFHGIFALTWIGLSESGCTHRVRKRKCEFLSCVVIYYCFSCIFLN